MRRLIFVLIMVLTLAYCSALRKTVVPEEILQYCNGISRDEHMVRRCVEQELEAKERLSRQEIPHDLYRECRQLSWSTGKSYQVLETCINQFRHNR